MPRNREFKLTTTKQLRLSKETLRALSPDQIHRIAGGGLKTSPCSANGPQCNVTALTICCPND